MDNPTPTATDAYSAIQAEIDAAIGADDPAAAAAACRRARLALARAACSPSFDPRRSRAIAQALRELEHPGATAPVTGPCAPLNTR